MNAEQDINRELLLLASDINDCEVKLSSLRNRARDLIKVSEYAENEIVHLQQTTDRVKVGFAEAVNLLYKNR